MRERKDQEREGAGGEGAGKEGEGGDKMKLALRRRAMLRRAARLPHALQQSPFPEIARSDGPLASSEAQALTELVPEPVWSELEHGWSSSSSGGGESSSSEGGLAGVWRPEARASFADSSSSSGM